MFQLSNRFLAVSIISLFPVTIFAADQFHSALEPKLSRYSAKYFQSEQARADLDQEFWQSLADRQYFLGDPWNYRQALAEEGFAVTLTYVTNIAGNPVGGVSRGFTETDSTGLSVAVDFEKLAGLEGLTGFVSTAYRQGTSLSLRRIHNTISVQQVYGGQTFHLVNMYLRQKFFDDQFMLKVGRIAQFDDFSHDFSFGYYMNNAFDGQPVGFFFQGPFTAYPVTTWGAIGKWGMPLDDHQGVYAFLGVYGADSEIGNNEFKGADFSFSFNQGANIMAEIGYKRNWGKEDRHTDGLSTKVGVGGWWFTGDFKVATLAPGSSTTKSGIGGFYYLAHQGLYRENNKTEGGSRVEEDNAETYWGTSGGDVHNEQQGLFVWTSGQFAGGSTSIMDVFVSGGTYYRGLIPGRNKDVLALGYYHAFFSDQLADSQRANGIPAQDHESAIELGYRYYVTDYFYVQPNIQGIFNPGGAGLIDDALVLGAQIEVDF
ncbi:carbohydrate porin [Rubellicoccus peritrichatus]|uniref:Carbohydrate porin n=1 Tax=Rubellicoccus peritrichatus TaxID=3080537 RepID=A0AAQ3LBV7_9BACT|nr:carbohydrate porin [Puniceicoccus sp. CR14]WOO42551.1 carbohydrate porin [Puniceicoccus sp. CR14]